MFAKFFTVLLYLLIYGSISCYQTQPYKTETKVLIVGVGNYSHANVTGPYIGLMDKAGYTIGQWDDVQSFNHPNHNKADFLWFTAGSIAWNYEVTYPFNKRIKSLKFTAELASESPNANWDWPSEVNLHINNESVGTWTLPGDPDGKYGLAKRKNHLPPSATQYGWLITWTVNFEGTFVQYESRLGNMPMMKVSNASIGDLKLHSRKNSAIIEIMLTVSGIDGNHGVNIFGQDWGDYDSSPKLVIDFVE